MKNTQEKQSSTIPVVTLSDAFAAIKAVGRGQAKLPGWEGKEVYVGTAAMSHWESVQTHDTRQFIVWNHRR